MIYHHIKERLINFQFALILCSFITFLHASEVGKLFYKGDIGELKDSTITISEKGVALSEIIIVEPFDHLIFPPPPMPTIILLIDHSGSMCYDYGPAQPDYPMDQWGERFIAVHDIIDTLKKYLPSAEVGLAVFREHLYFDPADNPCFVQSPEYDVGAYMPFFKLDSSYAPDGKMGWQILQELLEIDTVLARDDPLKPPGCPDDYQYVNLKYKPSNYEYNGLSRNINAAFDAAKHAFKSSQIHKYRHLIFFFSDGEADVANGPHTNPQDFVQGDSVPTTFTLFFTHDTTSSPQSLIDMTNNIQGNGYSTTNPGSNIWKININQQDLLQLTMYILSSIITVPHPHWVYFRPADFTINGIIKVSNWDSVTGAFTFNNHFPLVGVSTPFVYRTNYTGAYDSITPQGDTISIPLDSTLSGEFNIAIQDSANIPDHYPHEFELNCWERELGFYYNGNPVDTIYESMDTLEVRFIYDPGDAEYDYTNVDIEVTNTGGTTQDKETYKLLKSGDYTFSGTFPRVVIDNISPTIGDGTLQHYKADTIAATFRNNENSKLPLDTIRIAVPFKSSTAIHPNTIFSKGKFSFIITKTGSMQNILRIYNLPENGKISLYAINGRKIFEQSLNRGNSSLLLPKSLSQAIYFLNLEYGNIVLREKILFR